MGQTIEGALKIAAKKTNTPLPEYLAKRAAGEKWCYLCRDWHSVSSFGKNKRKADGLDAACRNSRKTQYQQNYESIPQELSRRGQRPPTPARDGDKQQARRTVNNAVLSGKLPRPNDLPCMDCGHIWR